MWRFIALFLIVLAVLFGIEKLNPVQVALIYPWTSFLAWFSAGIMTVFDSDVISHGRVIQSQAAGFGVSIEAGCNGVEAVLILIAGMVVLVCCQGLVQRGSSAFFANHFCTGGGSHALIRSMSVSGSVSASTRGRCSTRTNCCSVARSKKASSGS